MNIEEIIEAIKWFCYNYSPIYKPTHQRFQDDLCNSLRKKGCKVIKEYGLFFDNVKENGEIVERGGYVDLFVFVNQQKIAVEFDGGNNLKLKSISKLLQSEADILIGIVRGNQRYNVWYSNKRRITDVMKRLQILRKPILLIINYQKSASWIHAFYERSD